MNGHGHDFEHEFVSKSLSETDSGMRFFASDADTGVHSDTNLDLYGHEVFWTPDKDLNMDSGTDMASATDKHRARVSAHQWDYAK